MTYELTNFEPLKFPKTGKILRDYTPELILNEWLDIKKRLEYFKYTEKDEDINDLRLPYVQFLDDADRFLDIFRELVLDITEAMKYYNSIKDQSEGILKIAKQQKENSDKFTAELMDKDIDPLDPMHTARLLEKEIEERLDDIKRRNDDLDKAEQEIAITEQVLAKKKSEMEMALTHRYTLSEKQKTTLLEEKDKILDGIEQWGSVYSALSHDKTITSKPSTIQMYCQLFPEFAQAVEVSKALFKDRIESILIERAIEGTENPVFGKGEHIGDFKIKDNKMLLELLKARIPEVYNKRATESTKSNVTNNVNILSFANVNEKDEGYVENVGVVLDVDDTGKVERIKEEQKMIDFYTRKGTAEILLPDDVNNDDKGGDKEDGSDTNN